MHALEFIPRVENAYTNQDISHSLKATSPRWAYSYLTNDYDQANEITHGNWDLDIPRGFNIYYHNQFEQYAKGIYKVTNNNSTTYFYIDFRDSMYGANSGCGYSADFTIKYDAGSNSYSYKGTGQSSYTQISVGEYVPIYGKSTVIIQSPILIISTITGQTAWH